MDFFKMGSMVHAVRTIVSLQPTARVEN
jgi:hypothetical protein